MCDRSSTDEGTAPSRGRSPEVSHSRFTRVVDGQEADVVDHHSKWEESNTESVVTLSGSMCSDLVEAAQEVRKSRVQVSHTTNEARRIRGWKLFRMIHRMLLVKRTGSLMLKGKVRDRLAQFAQGRWIVLISASREGGACVRFGDNGRFVFGPSQGSRRPG